MKRIKSLLNMVGIALLFKFVLMRSKYVASIFHFLINLVSKFAKNFSRSSSLTKAAISN